MNAVALQKTGPIAVLRINNPPVNALSQSVRAGLLNGLSDVEADPSIQALVLVGHGRGFIAGADIKEFGKPLAAPFLPDVCARLEKTGILVVAALHGVSLGGGLEVALAAHFRVAHPDARMGLPEVNLGLIPGAGGTQRLPRLIGTEKAVDLITTGQQVSATEACQLGLVDAILPGDPEQSGVEFAKGLIAGQTPPRRTCDIAKPAALNWEVVSEAVMKKANGRVAPVKALEAIKAGTQLSFADAMAAERRIFLELMETDQRDCLVHAFFAERRAKAVRQSSTSPRTLNHVGIVGGGTMGAGIATNTLLSGFAVTLVETDDAALLQAEKRISKHLSGAVQRGKISQSQMDDLLSKSLNLSTEFESLAKADLVIEAIYEDLDAKRAVFRKLDEVCKKDAILASNTSYLDIEAIASVTDRPDQILGLHYFSPAHVMKLLEVVVIRQTASDVVATAFAFAKRVGKLPVRTGNCDGFIGNRILRICRAAADQMVLSGATPQEVDGALRAFGFAMGPYEVADLAGLDIAWAMRKRRASAGHEQDTPAQFADRLCEEGYFGRKTGAGYYVYEQDQSATVHVRAMELIEAERAAKGISQRTYSPDEIQNHYLAVMVNEAACILHEGVARCPGNIDVVLMSGYGFPRHRGGPCKWADLQGLGHVLKDIEAFAAESGAVPRPADFLRNMIQENRTFDDLNQAAL